jgi:hypothetical protein
MDDARKLFYCISHYDGEIGWLNNYSKNNHIVYCKGPITPSISNTKRVENTGYNISSYLDFIVNNYDNLPDIIVFCKNNIFERHILEDKFKILIQRKVFTCREDERFWSQLSFPTSSILNDGGYIEFNNSWYSNKYKFKYFCNYNEFYKYIFDCKAVPTYLRFSPGANYIVPKENIQVRSKVFYSNLYKLITHDRLSCESHYLERTLYSIWNSNLNGSMIMNEPLNEKELNRLNNLSRNNENYKNENRIKRFLYKKSINFIHKILY